MSAVHEEQVRSLILSRFLPYQLNNIAKRISDACSSIYSGEFGLTIGQWRVLAMLGEVEQMKAKDLGVLTLMDKSRVSRIIQQLQVRGLLHRVRDPDDQRVFNISLTPAGQQHYAAIVPRALEWEARVLQGLDLPEYRDLLRIIEKLDRRLDVMESSAVP